MYIENIDLLSHATSNKLTFSLLDTRSLKAQTLARKKIPMPRHLVSYIVPAWIVYSTRTDISLFQPQTRKPSEPPRLKMPMKRKRMMKKRIS